MLFIIPYDASLSLSSFNGSSLGVAGKRSSWSPWLIFFFLYYIIFLYFEILIYISISFKILFLTNKIFNLVFFYLGSVLVKILINSIHGLIVWILLFFIFLLNLNFLILWHIRNSLLNVLTFIIINNIFLKVIIITLRWLNFNFIVFLYFYMILLDLR